MLEAKNLEVRRKDAMQMCFFFGFTSALALVATGLYFVRPKNKSIDEMRE